MRRFALMSALALPACLAVCAGQAAAQAVMLPPKVQAELIAMGRADQAIRKGLSAQKFADTTFARTLIREDSGRTERLRAIVHAYGWPTSKTAGQQAAAAAFLILQHSMSLTLQARMLPVLDSLARRREIDTQEFALLTDRVNKARHQPQVYGTQFDVIGGKLVMYKVADEGALDARRAALGLMSMTEYMKRLEAMYRMPVVRHQ